MSAIKYLIRVQDIKDRGFIHGNVEEKMLSVILKRVQDIEIQPLLGTKLYNKLLADTPNYTGAYLTLVRDQLVDVIVTSCELMAIVSGNYKIRNKNVGAMNDQYGAPATAKEMDDLRLQIEGQNQFYKKRLLAWLCQNKQNIPEYTEAQQDKDLSPDKKIDYFRMRII